MLSADQLKRFSNQCLKLRETLQKGRPISQTDYSVIKSHIQSLIAELDEHTEETPSSNLDVTLARKPV
jgi:hypothetical protein